MAYVQPDLFDKKGRQIKEFDLLKVYHFTGARNKKYYMYKWVIRKGDYLYGHHLCDYEGSFLLTQDLLADTEIIHGYGPNGQDDYMERERR